LGSFDRSNLLARRLASAAHFYGAPFGTEAALIINAENAANALYESLANGAALIHDDPQNILRSVEVQRAMRPTMVVDPPVTAIAVFYPVEDNMLELDGFDWKDLTRRCAEFRRLIDYDVCDTTMIADGYLAKKRDLFFVTNTHLREEIAEAILAFAAGNGRVWLYKDMAVEMLHRSASLVEMAAGRGMAVGRPESVGTTGVYRFDDWQQVIPHVAGDTFSIPADGPECYRTMHQRHESCYFPKKQRFEIRKRSDV
jgi:hypothetical protein